MISLRHYVTRPFSNRDYRVVDHRVSGLGGIWCKWHTESTEITEIASQARRASNVPQSRWSSESRIMSYMNYAERFGAKKEAKKHFSLTFFDTKKEALFSYFLRREERSKYLSFSWRKKRTKRTSTLPKAPPYMEGMQPESRRNRRLSVGFGIAGHAMSFLSAAQRKEGCGCLSAAQRKEGEEDEERRKMLKNF